MHSFLSLQQILMKLYIFPKFGMINRAVRFFLFECKTRKSVKSVKVDLIFLQNLMAIYISTWSFGKGANCAVKLFLFLKISNHFDLKVFLILLFPI